MTNASLCIQGSAFQNLDLPRIIASVLVADEEVNLDPFHKLRRMEFLPWLGLELLFSWQEPNMYLSQLDESFSHNFFWVGFRYLWKTSYFPLL